MVPANGSLLLQWPTEMIKLVEWIARLDQQDPWESLRDSEDDLRVDIGDPPSESDDISVHCDYLHHINATLWFQEDLAREKKANDSRIAAVKRNIDRLNQRRNDTIEVVDAWIDKLLQAKQITAASDGIPNTETPGSAVDRISIMSLRLAHYRNLIQSESDSIIAKESQRRYELCVDQRIWLAETTDRLMSDILVGKRPHRVIRQLKTYNDARFNKRMNG